MSLQQHRAAILHSKGASLKVSQRSTPSPGPNQLLVEVKSIALNLIDYAQRDAGFMLSKYPVILGSDIAGTVLSTGSSVPSDLKEGTRVAAFAPTFFCGGAPDYGAFQQYVLVSSANAVPLPENMTFNEASLLPMAVFTAWSGWYSIGLPRDTAFKPDDKKGMLVWGGASSVGGAVVQIGKLMGFTVYATASEKHHEYVKKLGASRVFDYRSNRVVDQIVKAAKEDGVSVSIGYDAAGQSKHCVEILKLAKGKEAAKLASAIPLKGDEPKVEGVEVKFVAAPKDVEEQTEHIHFVFNIWLKERLEKGEFVPGPKVQVVGKGVESVKGGLDSLKKGVSRVELVVEV